MPSNRTWTSFVLLPVFVAGAWFAFGCKQEEPFRIIGGADPSSKECASCHEAVYEDWVSSAHAMAWTRDSFQEGILRTDTGECMGCHAPKPIYTTDESSPTLRKAHVDEGVNCIACHSNGCTHLNARNRKSDSGIPLMRTSRLRDSTRLCGVCHMDTYEEWKEYALRRNASKTCTDCHMLRPDGGHDFNPFYEGSVTIEVTSVYRRKSGGLEINLELHNRTAGHAIPTGLFGFRELRLEAWFQPDKLSYKRFFIEMGTALEPGRNGPYRFFFDDNGDLLHARVVRIGKNGEELATLGSYASKIEIREQR